MKKDCYLNRLHVNLNHQPCEVFFCNKLLLITFQVSYPPFIFDCALYAPVNDQDGSVEINNGVVIFKLEKETPALWGRLHHPDSGEFKFYQSF